MQPLKNFYIPLSAAPQKCVKSGPTLANAGPAHGLVKPDAERLRL